VPGRPLSTVSPPQLAGERGQARTIFPKKRPMTAPPAGSTDRITPRQLTREKISKGERGWNSPFSPFSSLGRLQFAQEPAQPHKAARSVGIVIASKGDQFDASTRRVGRRLQLDGSWRLPPAFIGRTDARQKCCGRQSDRSRGAGGGGGVGVCGKAPRGRQPSRPDCEPTPRRREGEN